MKMTAITILALALLGGCADSEDAVDSNRGTHGQAIETVAAPAIACDDGNGGLELPAGFCAVVVADDLGRARHLAVRDNGDVYVAIRGDDGGVVGLRDSDGDGRADLVQRFGAAGGSGIGLRDGYLYFASDIEIMRYRLGPDLSPGAGPESVVSGFAEQPTHAVKPFSFGADGALYVNIGAPSNACQEIDRAAGGMGLDPCPMLETSGGIWRFEADRTGQRFADGRRFASGIRNGVANAVNPANGKLYVVQHGRDQLSELFPRLYTDEQRAELPAEEFFEVDRGDGFGWPYCYFDHLQGAKVLAPEYGGDGKEVGRCNSAEDPIVAFPGHWAPNDLVFYDGAQFPAHYRGGAFVAFHGSWNRQPFVQKGYNVAFVPFADGEPSGDYDIFADGFAGVSDLRAPGQAAHRPTGLAIGPDGSLYIADSVRGRIWRVLYKPQADGA